MKFSEGLFKFPIRVYDSLSVTKAILKEDLKLNNIVDDEDVENIEVEETDWVRGYARIPIQEIKAWTDIFSEGSNVKDIAEKGFSETMIITKTMGPFECLWSMKRLEDELDSFVEMYSKGIDNIVEEEMIKKRESVQIVNLNKRKWRFW